MTPIQQMLLGVGGLLQKFFGDKGIHIGGMTNQGSSVNDFMRSVSIQTISTGANSTDWGDLYTFGGYQIGSSMSDGSKAYHHDAMRWYSNTQYWLRTYSVLTFAGGVSHPGYELPQDGTATGLSNKRSISNGLRGCWYGGSPRGSGSGATYRRNDYITFASLADATAFGTINRNYSDDGACGHCGNKTRGLMFWGGNTTYQIDYVVVDTTSNAFSFGDYNLVYRNQYGYNGRSKGAWCSNETRGIFMGGNAVFGGNSDTIGYITIDTTGNTTDFGDMQSGYYNHVLHGGCYSNGTRGVWAGGKGGEYGVSTESYAGQRSSYITISTTGDASSGGNLDVRRCEAGSSCSGD